MKKFIENIKKILKNKRLSALIRLAFWILFFSIIVLISRMSSNNYVPNSKTSETNLDTSLPEVNLLRLNNYQFTYKINENKYTGSYYNGVVLLYNSDNAFYITRNEILAVNEPSGILNYTYLINQNIYELITSSSVESETSYKDGSFEYNCIKENISFSYKVIDNYIISIEIDDGQDRVYINYQNLDDLEPIDIEQEKNKYIYTYKEDNND